MLGSPLHAWYSPCMHAWYSPCSLSALYPAAVILTLSRHRLSPNSTTHHSKHTTTQTTTAQEKVASVAPGEGAHTSELSLGRGPSAVQLNKKYTKNNSKSTGVGITERGRTRAKTLSKSLYHCHGHARSRHREARVPRRLAIRRLAIRPGPGCRPRRCGTRHRQSRPCGTPPGPTQTRRTSGRRLESGCLMF